jgi:hypothetical protein
MKRDSQDTMIKIIKEWKESGITLNDFAKKKGITKTKIQYWLRRLYPEKGQASIFPAFFEIGSETSDIKIQPENTSQIPGKLQIELTFPSGLCLKIFG